MIQVDTLKSKFFLQREMFFNKKNFLFYQVPTVNSV